MKIKKPTNFSGLSIWADRAVAQTCMIYFYQDRYKYFTEDFLEMASIEQYAQCDLNKLITVNLGELHKEFIKLNADGSYFLKQDDEYYNPDCLDRKLNIQRDEMIINPYLVKVSELENEIVRLRDQLNKAYADLSIKDRSDLEALVMERLSNRTIDED